MPNEIDELMSLDPLTMTVDDLDAIIAYHRKNRANAELGIKPPKASGPKLKLDLKAMGLIQPKPVESVKRRV